MSDRDDLRYYGAIAASGISVLGWLGAVVAAGYTGYGVLFGGPVETPALATLAALAVGIWFARIEKSLYRVE